ncbi:ZRANB3 [Symbiodinium natans]|uniref:ZRANB3 protein n=1 Tax=Symbiodinium natans TaxID=878477 RepID=A0A812UWI5_9DINO|nr:ZRANB3 [Symbiodinium natans]
MVMAFSSRVLDSQNSVNSPMMPSASPGRQGQAQTTRAQPWPQGFEPPKSKAHMDDIQSPPRQKSMPSQSPRSEPAPLPLAATLTRVCQARSSQPKQSHQTHELQLQHTPKSPAGESGDPISVFSNQAVQAQSLAPTPPRTLPRRRNQVPQLATNWQRFQARQSEQSPAEPGSSPSQGDGGHGTPNPSKDGPEAALHRSSQTSQTSQTSPRSGGGWTPHALQRCKQLNSTPPTSGSQGHVAAVATPSGAGLRKSNTGGIPVAANGVPSAHPPGMQPMPNASFSRGCGDAYTRPADGSAAVPNNGSIPVPANGVPSAHPPGMQPMPNASFSRGCGDAFTRSAGSAGSQAPGPCGSNTGSQSSSTSPMPCAVQPVQPPGRNPTVTSRPIYAGVHVQLELCPKPWTSLVFLAKCQHWPPNLLAEVQSWPSAAKREDGEVSFRAALYKSTLERFEGLASTGLQVAALPSWACTVAGFDRGGEPVCGGLPAAEARSKAEEFLKTLPQGSSVLPYQVEAVAFGLQRGGRALLGDEMGLGKTLQALLLAAQYEAEWPLLVVAPSSLRFVWREQAAQWLPHLVGAEGGQVQVIRTGKDKVNKCARVVVATYDLLRRSESLRRRADGRDYLAVIVDESQSIKEASSQRTKVVVGICKAARRVFLLSGTPAVNRAAELYTQLEALMPAEMPSFAQFAERFCYKQTQKFGRRTTIKWAGVQRPSELNCLLSTVMIRRLKKDVLQQLPEKRRMRVPLDPEKMDQDTLREVERRSRQLGEVDFSSGKALGDIAQLFRQTTEAKKAAVLDYVEHLLSLGTKFLIFGHHHLMLDALEEKLQRAHYGYIRIDGRTTASDRPKLVSRFQEEESVRVAVLSITAAGTGLTLTAAQTVVFAELYWVPGQMQQAEDRAHRIGQRDCVSVHYLIAKGTLDDMLYRTLEKKTVSTTSILNGQGCGLEILQHSPECDASLKRKVDTVDMADAPQTEQSEKRQRSDALPSPASGP